MIFTFLLPLTPPAIGARDERHHVIVSTDSGHSHTERDERTVANLQSWFASDAPFVLYPFVRAVGESFASVVSMLCVALEWAATCVRQNSSSTGSVGITPQRPVLVEYGVIDSR